MRERLIQSPVNGLAQSVREVTAMGVLLAAQFLVTINVCSHGACTRGCPLWAQVLRGHTCR